jgi:hypothetical protein
MEALVTDNSQAVAAGILGALIGGGIGYFFFSEHGRSLRRQLEPALDELSQFGSTLRRAAVIADEGWKMWNETMHSESRGARYPGGQQTTPF